MPEIAPTSRTFQCAIDPELRVHGFDNLRVVDAWIMPRLSGFNTNVATIMVGREGG